jgi:hypothetical protein
LLWAALIVSLALAACVVWFAHPTPEPPGADATPLTDQQAAAQVVDAARRIVAAAKLEHATAGYMFVSCANDSDPPYQAALYMNFALPQDNSGHYLKEIAAAMVADGWAGAPTAGENLGQKLTKDGVISVFYRNPSRRDFATMRLYGECRTTSDHHHDDPLWTEVQL